MSAPAIDLAGHDALEQARVSIEAARRRGRTRGLVVGVAFTAVIVVTFLVTMSSGEFTVPLADIIPASFGRGDELSVFIVQTLRLPRVLTAFLVGIGFATAGAIFQNLLRNPLASPDVLGITSGASLAAVVVITASGGRSTGVLDISGAEIGWLPAGAILGATVTALLMYVLAYRRGVSPYRLILIGIGVAAVAQAAIDFLLTRALEESAARAFVWLTGTLNTRTWQNVTHVAVGVAILVPMALLLNARLRALQLGDDAAAGLGVHVQRMRLALIMVGVGLIGVSVAAAGPIAFVSLLAPPIARRVARSPGPVLILSALAGAALVMVADLVAQNLLPGGQIPVGIVTGAIGAPYMLWLLARANRIGAGG